MTITPEVEEGYPLWLKVVAVQSIFVVILFEYYLFGRAYKGLGNHTQENRERNKKYFAFERLDIDRISRLKVYPLVPFIIPRFILGFGPMFLASLFLWIISLTQDSDQYIGWRGYLIEKICNLAARLLLITCGVWPGLYQKEEPLYDYKKYLGPDWKPTNSIPSCVCTNHQSWMDIMVHMSRQRPSHVAKEATKKIPAIGYISQAVGCLYVDRGANKGGKSGLQDIIIERQKQCEKGLYPPLIFYPEGGTSNGRYLQKFKRGAFVGLSSIKPVLIKYYNPFFDAENCVMKIQCHCLLALTAIYQSVKVITLPVFQPNDFFFQNHQKEGEEKWETYQRVIRDIMSDALGCPKCDLSIDDKFKYKELVYPKQKGKRSD